MPLQLVFEKQVKILILKIEAEEKGFQVKGIVSKKTSKWTVLAFCVEYEAKKMLGRIMSKTEKKSSFLLSCHTYLFGANNCLLMLMLFTYWASADCKLQTEL